MLRVVFDRELADVPLDIPNWTVHVSDYRMQINLLEVAGDSVVGGMTQQFFQPRPNAVSYTPPPFDVTDVHGNPAQPFTGFPLEVFP